MHHITINNTLILGLMRGSKLNILYRLDPPHTPYVRHLFANPDRDSHHCQTIGIMETDVLIFPIPVKLPFRMWYVYIVRRRPG
jgi:hypothetical protein